MPIKRNNREPGRSKDQGYGRAGKNKSSFNTKKCHAALPLNPAFCDNGRESNLKSKRKGEGDSEWI